MKKSVIFWIIMIIFTLCGMEIGASVYYFHRANYDSPFAVIQIWHSVKERLIRSRILKPRTKGYYVSDDRYGWTLKKKYEHFEGLLGS